ncbi:DUF3857 domain-containing protein [Aggregicoccus sp. 17bor-14]|uniref:DUF3857 domain-containing protein n=1 Tax=Myxococcaceae TaxID=31 RepID=UPI00129D10AB|nr:MULTISPECIES: DUF3857 domain-containing protein [Myxococcaceae]MBF5041869.1 DUF3857 domain-containing protein [Simulacricoccus sp. 17bor-14]MRI87650.1 DUF3857 domain-containing protein [Aggregicoccus sp. 17bor-14]
MRSTLLAALVLVTPASSALAAAPATKAAAAPAAPSPWEGAPFSATAADVARAVAALPVPQDAYAELLLEETHLSFDAKGVESYRYRRVFRVLSQEGARGWGHVDVPWSPWYQERPEVRARVINRDGQEHVLDAGTLMEAGDDERSTDIFSDRRALRGPLPAVAEGSVVELEIQVRGKDSLFSAGTSGRVALDDRMPVRKVRVVLEAPRALPLRAELRGLKLSPRREEKEGRVRLTWEAGPLAARAEAEPYLPPELPQGAALSYATGKDWQSLAQRYHQVVEEQLAGADLAAQAAEAAGSETRPERVAARVMAWVHARVRYTGLYSGAAAVVPRPPGETLSRRFGDCKDLATLVVGMLRARGIPAHVALLRVRDAEVEPDFPGLGRFDHAIVYVPGTPALWVDATDPYTAVGELNLGVQGRLALVAAPGTRALQRLPEARSTANSLRITRTVLLAEDGPARVREATDATGSIAATYRSYFAATPPDKLKEGFERYAQSGLREAKLDGAVRPRELATGELPFHLDLEVTGSKLAETDGARAVVRISPYPAITRMPDALRPSEEEDGEGEKRKARTQDLLLPEAFVHELSYRVVPPEGYRAATLPAAREVTFGPAKLSWRFEQQGRDVLARIRFDTGKRRYSAQEVEAFRTAVQAFGKEDAPWLTLESEAHALIAEGKVREGLEQLRARAARHPTEALHHLQLAEALLKLGMGEDARAEAKAAAALEPKSAEAQRTLARMLMHDTLGRELMPGFDGPGAVAALRRAKALDPKEPNARLALARMLSRGTDGELYGAGARLPEAIAEYQALRTELDKKDWDGELRAALWQAERFGDFLQLAGKGEEARSADALAARAVLEGVPAALREAQARISDPEARRSTLARASLRLMGLRRYPECTALLRELAGSGSAQLQTQLAMMAKVRRVEAKDLTDGDPLNVVKRMMLASADPSLVDVRTLFSRSALAEDKDFEKGFLAGLRYGTRALQKQSGGLPARVAMEVGLSIMELKSDGDARTGVRVRMPKMTGGEGEQAFFLVKEGAAWRVRAVAPSLGSLGTEALTRLDAGDVAGARQWLDWAREQVPQVVAENQPYAHFARLWPRGSETPREPARMRVAAAALASHGSKSPQLRTFLEQERARATSDSERELFDRDIAFASLVSQDKPRLLAAADRLLALHPDDESAFAQVGLALSALERWDELATRAQARLARLPDDDDALNALATAKVGKHDYEGNQRTLRQLVTAGKANPSTYNNLAWYALFTGAEVSPQTIEDAERAATLSKYERPSVLNTLATVYAEAGRGPQAHELLLKYMAQSDERSEPTPSDWYVHARVAEGYGLLDTARSAYQKVREENPSPSSAVHLAKRRLENLGKATPARVAAPAAP